MAREEQPTQKDKHYVVHAQAADAVQKYGMQHLLA